MAVASVGMTIESIIECNTGYRNSLPLTPMKCFQNDDAPLNPGHITFMLGCEIHFMGVSERGGAGNRPPCAYDGEHGYDLLGIYVYVHVQSGRGLSLSGRESPSHGR